MPRDASHADGAGLAQAQPTAAELRAAVEQLLHRARIQVGSCTYWAQESDCRPELFACLEVLAAQIETARRALFDAEHAH